MLTPEALDVVLPLAERCDRNNFIVMPMQGTPLGELVRETRSAPEFAQQIGDGSYVLDLKLVTSIANAINPLYNANQHTESLQRLGSSIGKALAGQISFIQTTVKPTVEDLALRVGEILANQSVSSLLGMEVIVNECPEVMVNNGFLGMIDKYFDVPFDNLQLTLNLPDQTGDELKELLKTGSSNVDGDVESLIADVGVPFLCDIYGSVFQCRQEGLDSRGSPTLRQLMASAGSGRNAAIIIFLLASRLFEKPLPGTEMSERMYENALADVRGQAGAQLCRFAEQMRSSEKTGALIVSYSTTTVTVDGPLYKKFLEAGGDNEILFGNLLSGSPEILSDNIMQKAARFKTAWASHCNMIKGIEATKKFDVTKEAFLTVFRQQLNEIQEDATEGAANNADTVMQKFCEELDDVREADMSCLFTLAMKLTCRSRFATTHAEQILSSMETFHKQNPTVPMDEVASVTYLRYIARWVSKLMIVQPV